MRDTVPSIREEVAAIVKKALAIDVASRYASAEEMLADLKRANAASALDSSMLASPSGAHAVDIAFAATAVQSKPK